MKLPSEAGVMILGGATLFPQSLLPLYIFEPRYRRLLAETLASHRMFVVAMQRPETKRVSPAPVAGLGLIRVAVRHDDGTSHLILQGLERVELGAALRYRPYRIHRILPLPCPPADTLRVDALRSKLRELVERRLQLGLAFPFPIHATGKTPKGSDPEPITVKDMLKYLDGVHDPAQMADLITCAVLPGASERQAILETVDVEARLHRLIEFLLVEIRRAQKGKHGE